MTAAREYAMAMGTGALRVTMTLWQPEPAPPMGAMVTIWRASGVVARTDELVVPVGVEISYALDVESFCTAWRD